MIWSGRLAAIRGEDRVLCGGELYPLGQLVAVQVRAGVDVGHVVLLEGRAPALHCVDQTDVVVFLAVSADQPPATIEVN